MSPAPLPIPLLVLLPLAAATAPQPPIVEAGEITISSTRSERGALELAGHVSRIDRAAIERSGASSVPELLRREAGLFVTNTTGTPEGFQVEARGFLNGGGNGCSTLVLLDGRRLNEPETGCADWSFVSLEEIERIEIVRGPASVAYGDNAAAGMIQIFTRRLEEDGVRAATRLATGSWGSQSGSARVDGRAGGVSARAFFDHLDTNGYRDQAGFDADASHLGLGIDLAGLGALRLDGGYDSNFRERPGTLTRAEVHADRRQADPDSLGDFDRARARFLQAALDLAPHEDVALRLTPYVRRRTDGALLSGLGFDFTTESETEQLGLDGQLEVGFDAWGRRHTLLAGGELRREDSDVLNVFRVPGFTSTTDAHLRRETGGLFVQQELALHDDWLLLVGARRDVVDYDGGGDVDGLAVGVDEDHDVWSPKAALTWRVADPASLYVSWARGFRSANLQETVSLAGVDPLDPQRSESTELGAKLRTGRATANFAVYWMNVQDEILFDPTTFSNRNLERVRHRGVEWSGSLALLAWLDLTASYTFDDVEIQRGVPDAGRIPLTPRHRGALGAFARLPHGFELGADARFVGSRPLANDLDNDSESLPSYTVYDARLAWRGTRGPVALVLEAVGRNLTNREYDEVGGEATFGGPPGYYPAAERSYWLGARVELRR